MPSCCRQGVTGFGFPSHHYLQARYAFLPVFTSRSCCPGSQYLACRTSQPPWWKKILKLLCRSRRVRSSLQIDSTRLTSRAEVPVEAGIKTRNSYVVHPLRPSPLTLGPIVGGGTHNPGIRRRRQLQQGGLHNLQRHLRSSEDCRRGGKHPLLRLKPADDRFQCMGCPWDGLDFSQSLFGHFVGGEQNNNNVGIIYGTSMSACSIE